MSDASASQKNLRWYQGLDRYCWIVLTIAALGWLFDTMDQNLFNLVRKPSLESLIRPTLDAAALAADPSILTNAVNQKAGLLTTIFLIGWSVGGFVFGILGDKIGRTGTMILTILIYAVFTGLSGLAPNWEIYAVFRFLTALGVGGEWAAGAAIVAEVFPARSRPMALGLLQALSAVGNMMAALITLGISGFEGGIEANWRIAYFVGALPALLVLWIRRSVREPEQWHEAKSLGQELGNISELFRHPVMRRNLIAAILLATAGVGAVWGVAFFSPDLMQTELKTVVPDAKARGQMTSIIFLVQQVGAFVGIYLFAVFAERFGRKPAFLLWYTLSYASILAFFWGIQGAGDQAFGRALILGPILGFCTLGAFSGFTVYFPELFPTRLRTTGCGLGYNAARILAAVAPMALGGLTAVTGGLAQAASLVGLISFVGFIGAAMGPETKGKPLPE